MIYPQTYTPEPARVLFAAGRIGRKPQSPSRALAVRRVNDAEAVIERAAEAVAGCDAVDDLKAMFRAIPEAEGWLRQEYASAGWVFGGSDAGLACHLQRVGLRERMAEAGWVWDELDVRRVHALNELERLIRNRPA